MEEGKKVRDKKVTLTDGSKKKLSELAGKDGLVLYFYPKDSTPGCTKEACSFRDHYTAIKRKGYAVAGVSPDSPQSHQKFTEKQSINFELISDEDHSLAESFGVWVEKNMYGKKFMGIERSTFILDSSLKVVKVFRKVKVDGHTEAVINELKAASKQGQA